MRLALPPEVPAEHHWCVAVWDVTVEELERRGHVVGQGLDDLDAYHFVELDDEEVGDILLLHHDQSPAGFDVMVRADVPTCDALEAILRNFGVAPGDLQFVVPYSRFPGTMGELLSEEERPLARWDWASGQ